MVSVLNHDANTADYPIQAFCSDGIGAEFWLKLRMGGSFHHLLSISFKHQRLPPKSIERIWHPQEGGAKNPPLCWKRTPPGSLPSHKKITNLYATIHPREKETICCRRLTFPVLLSGNCPGTDIRAQWIAYGEFAILKG